MFIVNRLVRGAVLSGALLCAGGAAALPPERQAIGAITVPSDLMRPDLSQAAPGYVVHWTFSIEIESTEINGITRCRALLHEGGFLPALSTTASSASPVLHYRLAGHRDYAQADPAADAMLAAVKQARCAGTLSWNVASQMVPVRP